MKVLLRPQMFGKMWLVDWLGLQPYWERSWQCESVKSDALIDAFLTLWFTDCAGKRHFVIGHIDYFPAESMLMFSNGTHRTRVLAKRLRYLPVSAHAAAYRNKQLAPFFLRQIKKDEEFELPNFPVLSPGCMSPVLD